MAAKKSQKQNQRKAEPNGLTKREESREIGTPLAPTPFSFMHRFADEMDHIFGNFNLRRDWLAPVLGQEFGHMWSPQVEMLEHDGELIVKADLPGLTKDDVKVEIADNAITIEGERRGMKEEKREGFYRSERNYGKFYRLLPLPEGVEVQDAAATFNNGVLEIKMKAPKREKQQVRRLQINEAAAPKAQGKAA
jgi:HSP20 family protein